MNPPEKIWVGYFVNQEGELAFWLNGKDKSCAERAEYILAPVWHDAKTAPNGYYWGEIYSKGIFESVGRFGYGEVYFDGKKWLRHVGRRIFTVQVTRYTALPEQPIDAPEPPKESEG